MEEKPNQKLKDLGALIKKIRTAKSLSSAEFGYRCEMDKPNVNRLEKGNTNPTFLTLIRICKALEIELKDLLSEFKTLDK